MDVITKLSSRASGKEFDWHIYYYMSAWNLVNQLPVISNKKNTFLVIIRSLLDKWLIERIEYDNKSYYKITDSWKSFMGVEKNQESVENFQGGCWKKSRPGVEKNQDNQSISNQSIKDKRIDKEKKTFSPPTLEEVIEYFKQNWYKEEVAKKAFNVYNVADWYDTKWNKIKNRRQKMHSVWFTDQNKAPKETPKDNSHIEKLYNFDHLIWKI